MKLLLFIGASTGTFFAFKGITGDSSSAFTASGFFMILYALMGLSGKK